MDLPDYSKAAAFLGVLCQGHMGQHRCTDGKYYSPGTAPGCPVNGLTDAVLEVLDAARAAPHTACHDPAAVTAVAQAMCVHPDGTPVPIATLDTLQASWWVEKAHQAMEAHAALLDPDAVTA